MARKNLNWIVSSGDVRWGRMFNVAMRNLRCDSFQAENGNLYLIDSVAFT